MRNLLWIGIAYMTMASKPIVSAQIKPTDSLFLTISTMDSLLFDEGFNHCRLDMFEKTLSQDFEFYHDKSGTMDSKISFINAFSNNICHPHRQYRARRVLDEASMEVYPLYNNGQLYGAIQMSNHIFYEKKLEDNTIEKITGEAKIVHLWILENGQWKLRRSMSFDHQSK